MPRPHFADCGIGLPPLYPHCGTIKPPMWHTNSNFVGYSRKCYCHNSPLVAWGRPHFAKCGPKYATFWGPNPNLTRTLRFCNSGVSLEARGHQSKTSTDKVSALPQRWLPGASTNKASVAK